MLYEYVFMLLSCIGKWDSCYSGEATYVERSNLKHKWYSYAVPQVPQSYRIRSHLLKWIVGVVLLSGAICAVLILTPHPAKPLGPTAAQVEKQAQTLDNAHKFAAEQTLLQNYVTSHPSNPNQYPLLIQLGSLCLNNHDYASALRWYKQSESVMSKTQPADPAGAVGAAMAESALGNKTEAISYYRQAITLTTYQSPDNNVDSYKAAIQALGGTP
jgi:tetratricopeptide (TPR) repeat protein